MSKRIFGCEASKAAASSDNSLCEARAFQATDAATEFWPADARPARIDLHCHSDASNEADEAVLNSIQCPECFSTPREVY